MKEAEINILHLIDHKEEIIFLHILAIKTITIKSKQRIQLSTFEGLLNYNGTYTMRQHRKPL